MIYHSIILIGNKKEVDLALSKYSTTILNTSQFSTNPDYIEIVNIEKKTIGISDVKPIQQFAYKKSYLGSGKLIHIANADNLTIEAQNSLLKIIEEPPKDTQIVLSSKSLGNFLETIISRCKVEYLSKEEIDLDKIELPKNFVEALRLIAEIDKIKSASDKHAFLESLFRKIYINLKHELVENQTYITRKKTAERLKLVQDIHKKISANVNLKTALEFMFIKLQK